MGNESFKKLKWSCPAPSPAPILCRGLLARKRLGRKEKEGNRTGPGWQYPKRRVGTVFQQTFGRAQAQVGGSDVQG